MKRFVSWVLVALMASTLVIIPAGSAMADLSDDSSIWVTDDFTKQTYNLTLDGVLNFSFGTPNTGVSSVDVDHRDGTLWGANDRSNKLVHYTFKIEDGVYKADVIEQIFLDGIGSIGSEGVAVALSHDDDTLWVVDDPASTEPGVPNVYNVTRDGELVFSFPTSMYDEAARSPQSIAFDPFDETLWISDNAAEAIYNVSQEGALLGKFRTNSGPFVTTEDPSGVLNVQGIGVESRDVLWLTARDTGKVYRVTKSGDEVLESFASVSFDSDSSNPTGVAFNFPEGVGIGAAGSYTLLALSDAKVKIKDGGSGVVGDVGLSSGSRQDFDDGLLTGSLLVDPGADNSNDHGVVISGDVVEADLWAAADDALRAAAAAADLPAAQTLGEIKSSVTINGGPGRNVINAEKIELDNGETLTLVGDSSSEFVLNLEKKIKLKDRSSVALVGGVRAENVLYNITGDEDSAIEGGSVAYGTILAPAGKVKVKGEGSLLIGAVIAGNGIELEDWGRVRSVSSANAPGDLGAATSAAALALPTGQFKISDAASTIDGDVLLGPLSKQEFSSGLITGSLRVDPAADNTRTHNVVIQGGTVVEQLSKAAADAIDAGYVMASLDPGQTFGEIKSSTTIVGSPGINVIEIKKIELNDGETLTLSGDPSSVFIINVEEDLKVKNASAIVVAGGQLADKVLLNVLRGGEAVVEKGSSVHGNILTVFGGKAKIKGSGSQVVGGVFSAREIAVEEGAVISG